MKPKMLFLNDPSEGSEDTLRGIMQQSEDEAFPIKDVQYIYTHFTKPAYGAYKNLKAILCPCTGVKHLEPIPEDVKLFYLDDKEWLYHNVRSTAEWTINAMFTLLRQGNQELSGITVGLVGYGRVGQQVAKMLSGFDVNVLWYDPNPVYYEKTAPSNTDRASLGEVLLSDIVSVHVAEVPGTENLIGKDEFISMRDAYFINCSRASIVDGRALSDWVYSERSKGAYLDVTEGYSSKILKELNQIKSLTKNLNNVGRFNLYITPHIAGKGVQSREATDDYVITDFRRWYDELSR